MTVTVSRKVFLAVTLLIVSILSSVVVTYAEVIVHNVKPLQGTVTYSLNNAEAGTWTTTLTLSGPSNPWYSRLEINGDGYKGPVTVIWNAAGKEWGFHLDRCFWRCNFNFDCVVGKCTGCLRYKQRCLQFRQL